ncbi:MFS transporter [Sediminibacillus halophilus]|uniref:Predicted arabinose efflux permease, MFS family n=1 Tax=Sediminibacillus halophilus TaxID=482461 RepID=A0A1G9VEF8_9BACI|nr:MFS transporter [Sediminibacillus halophilus]SDM70245.1 Predicted arabinose efflux permease, MFS family [Sediminibacillus halophilus]
MVSNRVRFKLLIGLVTISGFSQGMLLPLLALILEQDGVPSSVNGLHATGLYIGVLLASPFMEKPMQKLGFKPMILIGGLLVFISLAFFPVWHALWFWFILRVTVGIGDHMLNFGTQTWITYTSTPEKRGRNIAYYGLFFSLGFSIGPTMTRLLSVNENLPFIISAVLCFLVWTSLFFIRNEWPQQEGEDRVYAAPRSSLGRFIKTWKLAWVALLPPFGYGFLEATLNGIFPVYGLRIGHDVDVLSLIIPCFAASSLITQIPLGILSDKIGRKKLLSLVLCFGSASFLLAALYEGSAAWLFITFALAGMCLGSIFSLGVSYMTDILPKPLLPAGNIMCGIAFSIGSISGPYLGGLFIDLFPAVSFFYVIVAMLIVILGALLLQQSKQPIRAAE